MKATIDRDDTQPITTTYQQKTISLAKARQMRHRPPALMNLEEANGDAASDEKKAAAADKDSNGLGIVYSDAVAAMERLGLQEQQHQQHPESARPAGGGGARGFGGLGVEKDASLLPQSA